MDKDVDMMESKLKELRRGREYIFALSLASTFDFCNKSEKKAIHRCLIDAMEWANKI